MKIKRFLIFLLTLIGLLLISACNNNDSEEPLSLSITDFKAYSNMTQDGTDSISVRYDNSTGKYFIFTIEDEAEISAVVEIIFNARFVDGGTDPIPPGNNSYLVIKQGKSQFGLSVNCVNYGGKNYYFGNELQSKIYELAVIAGAFETE